MIDPTEITDHESTTTLEELLRLAALRDGRLTREELTLLRTAAAQALPGSTL